LTAPTRCLGQPPGWIEDFQLQVIDHALAHQKSPAEAGLKFAMNGGMSPPARGNPADHSSDAGAGMEISTSGCQDQRIARGGRDCRAGVRGFLLHRVLLRNGLGHGGWRWRGSRCSSSWPAPVRSGPEPSPSASRRSPSPRRRRFGHRSAGQGHCHRAVGSPSSRHRRWLPKRRPSSPTQPPAPANAPPAVRHRGPGHAGESGIELRLGKTQSFCVAICWDVKNPADRAMLRLGGSTAELRPCARLS
jgi:hypothetical protein